jgi:hypothetical protein
VTAVPEYAVLCHYWLADPWVRQLMETALGPACSLSTPKTGLPGNEDRADAGG